MPGLQARVAPEAPSLNQVMRRIDDISTLPQVALRVMQVAGDANSGAGDMKVVMEGDPALSARVLRCVNSSAYSLRTKITNLQQAIAYLGLKQIRNLALTASVSDLFRNEEKIGSYSRASLWRHLVSVGICARMIAMRRNISNFEDAFLAGLLHDIGIALENQHAHGPFLAVIQSLNKGETLCETERRQLGFDHAMLGAKVAATWGFPDVARAAIRFHHASANYRGEEVNLVRCVEVANLICTLKGIPSVGVKLVKFSAPAIAGLALTKEDIAVLAEDLDREVAQNSSLFNM